MKKEKTKEPHVEKALQELTPSYSTPAPHPLAMDGTNVEEISIMANSKFSEELVKRAAEAYDLNKLAELKKSDHNAFLSEAEHQIKELWGSSESMAAHSDLFCVMFQIAIGKVLKEVESSFNKKSKYMQWFRDRFGDKHLRYFQQAKQLAEMGEFARRNAPIGKRRLLEFDRLRTSLDKPYEEILRSYPFPDITEDSGGILLSQQVDGIVTYERFKAEGIEIDFDQALLMGCFDHEPVAVNVVKKLKARLETETDKKQFLDNFIMEKMIVPQTEKPTESPKSNSLNKLLAELDGYRKTVNLDDASWISEQEQTLSDESLLNAFAFLQALIKKLGIKPIKKSTTKNQEVTK